MCIISSVSINLSINHSITISIMRPDMTQSPFVSPELPSSGPRGPDNLAIINMQLILAIHNTQYDIIIVIIITTLM